MKRLATPKRFGLTTPLDKIQAIRLCAALLETDYDVHFSQEAELILSHLSQYFQISYSIGLDDVPILDDIEISHEENPICRIGSIKMPLVYPKSTITKCRSMWQESRPITYSFSGLITGKRKQCLEKWMRGHFPEKAQLLKMVKEPPKNSGRLARFYKYLTGYRTNRKIVDKKIGLYIFASNQGRKFPIKVWDEEYYQTLSKSKFVLCPDGEFVWTYRFFESILCGAIPIIESYCPLYDGYHYFSMNQSISNLTYSKDLIDQNFQLAKQKLVLPSDQLNSELAKMLEKNK